LGVWKQDLSHQLFSQPFCKHPMPGLESLSSQQFQLGICSNHPSCLKENGSSAI